MATRAYPSWLFLRVRFGHRNFGCQLDVSDVSRDLWPKRLQHEHQSRAFSEMQ